MADTETLSTDCIDSVVFEWAAKISDATGRGLIIMDRDLNTLFVSPNIPPLFDLPLLPKDTELRNSKFLTRMAERGDFGDVSVDAVAAQYLAGLKRFMETGNEDGLPNEIAPPNGRRVGFKRYVLDDGKYLLIAVEDITERHLQNEGLEIAFELGKSGYWHYCLETDKMTVHSDYLFSLLDESECKALKENGFWEIIHADDLPRAREIWRNAVMTKTEFETVLKINVKSSPDMLFRLMARPQIAGSGRVTSFICNFMDITQELLLKRDLENAKETAEKTVQAQNNFLARLAHEIRTPMNAVVGIADALLHSNPNSDLSPKLELIQSSADSVMNILESTLSNAKLDAEKLALDPQPGSVIDTVRTACELWRPRAAKAGTEILFHLDKKVPAEVVFDKFRYEQCLNNLVSNAVKFTPNGRIDVVLTVNADPKGQENLLLAVKDTGIGMTPEQQTRIFDAYTQADTSISSRFGGTGLGMNITKQISEMMSGSISVQSEHGKGSVFVLSTPLERASAERPFSEAEMADELLDQIFEEKQREKTPYSDLRVLVVDDNATNHIVVESLLETVVHKIHKANNGEEAIEILRKKKIDVILMDIHMPVMDGIEATLKIRGSDTPWSDVFIIAVTADPQYQQLRLCRNIGMDETLAKPVKLNGLLQALDKILTMDRDSSHYAEAFKAAG